MSIFHIQTDCEAAIIIEHYVDSTSLQTFLGAKDYMRSQGIQVDVLQDAACIRMMTAFINANPQLWNEDIGV
jgi:hypothetical protein